MKLTTGKTIVSLNDYKKQLQDQNSDFEALKKEIEDKKQLLERSVDERKRVQQFIRGGKKKTEKLRQSIEDANSMEMPNIEDYIMQKKTMYELQSSLSTWKKKVEILEMAAKQSRTQLHRAKYFGSGSFGGTSSSLGIWMHE